MKSIKKVDYLIIGGGFYGCCLALFLRSISKNIVIIDAKDSLLSRASRVNQARVHTGFHYPRSAITAVKSMILHSRFANDFPDAVYDEFKMLYAIPKRRSLVSANRFYRMFREMNAPIYEASPMQNSLFDSTTVDAAFECVEHAFDYSVLRTHLSNRLDQMDIECKMSTEALNIEEKDDCVMVTLSDGTEVNAKYLFNVTYAGINQVLEKAQLPKARLKYELTEIALVEPSDELNGFGVTVMDGPFFSVMPYPAKGLYSLTHVRYTPHKSWTTTGAVAEINKVISENTLKSKVRHMILDGKRYLPSLVDAVWHESLYEIKTVLLKNEQDDGRPILYQREPSNSKVISIMGGKIDNIYDLFELIKSTEAEWQNADDRYVYSKTLDKGL